MYLATAYLNRYLHIWPNPHIYLSPYLQTWPHHHIWTHLHTWSLTLPRVFWLVDWLNVTTPSHFNPYLHTWPHHHISTPTAILDHPIIFQPLPPYLTTPSYFNTSILDHTIIFQPLPPYLTTPSYFNPYLHTWPHHHISTLTSILDHTIIF